jgi:hypothetical protein
VARAKTVLDPLVALSGGVVSRTTFRGRATNSFLPLPVDRTIELRIEIGEDFSGDFELGNLDRFVGARVKPVLYVRESAVETVDRSALRDAILALGAKYVKTPIVHVVRRIVRRDERHDVELDLEDSLRLFAEETGVSDPERKVAFAVALARESDALESETL